MNPELEWVRFTRQQFPREIAFYDGNGGPFIRKTVFDQNSYLYDIWQYLNSHHCWTSIYSSENIKENKYDCLAFDFDSINIKDSFDEAKSLYNYLKEVYDYEARIYFSGKKGFHVYIDFNPLEIKEFKAVTRRFYIKIREVLKLDTLDFSIVGDKRRVMRIPYTMHVSSKKLCIPIKPSWHLNSIITLASLPMIEKEPLMPQEFNNASDIRATLKEYIKEESKPKPQSPRREVMGKGKLKHELDLILKYSPQTEDHRHRILHFMLVPRLIILGHSDAEIRERCKNYIETTWGGRSYNEYSRYVEESIKRTKQGNWKPWSIETFLQRFPDATAWFRESK